MFAMRLTGLGGLINIIFSIRRVCQGRSNKVSVVLLGEFADGVGLKLKSQLESGRSVPGIANFWFQYVALSLTFLIAPQCVNLSVPIVTTNISPCDRC